MLKWFKTDRGDPCKDCSELIEKYQEAAYQLIEDNEKLERRLKEKIRSVEKQRNDHADENSKLKYKIKRLEKERDFHLLNYKRQEWLTKQPEEFRCKIDSSTLKARTANRLKWCNIEIYADLTEKTEKELLGVPDFGRRTLNDLKEHIKRKFPDDFLNFSMFQTEIEEIEQGVAMLKRSEDFVDAVIKHNARLREAIQ
tara:strand:+ start:2136 stop:2729 length:594 start_codon:yes stop_codon:yes gene_type:complete